MHIAVCITNKKTAAHLTQLFTAYQQQRGLALSYRFFDDNNHLLGDFLSGDYDALLFGGGGMRFLAAEIREKDQQVRLIQVVSTGASPAPLEKDIWYCLPEPIDALFLFPVLDRLSADIRRNSEAGLVLKTRGSVVRLAFSQIEYVEVVGRAVLFHLLSNKIEEVSGTFSDYEAKLLQWPDFVKVHRAYLINLRHVEKLTVDSILTRSGHTVPVSKHIYPRFRQDYLSGLPVATVKTPVAEQTLPPLVGHRPYHILLVDDEEGERQRWSRVLIEKGCTVTCAADEESALLCVGDFDCVVLDVCLGEKSGFAIARALEEKTKAPIVFLSALEDNENQARGFLAGGMDYIVKNAGKELFWLKLQARIKAATAARASLSSGALQLDLKQRKAVLGEQGLPLTSVEFDLLYLLLQNPNKTFTLSQLYQLIWGEKGWDGSHTAQLHLTQLCRKLENASARHSYIVGIWGEGYRFTPEK